MPRNTNKTTVSGATWRYGTMRCDSFIVTPHCRIVYSTPPNWQDNEPCAAPLCGYELVPPADHVAVFIHECIPAGHLAHAFPQGPTVAHMAGVLHVIAVGVLDLAPGR